MSKNKKPRNKQHRPRQLHNPVEFVLGGLKKIEPEHLTTLNSKNHAAMYKMTNGMGDKDAFDLLVGCVNMGNVMCELGTGEQYRDALIAARDALYNVGVRYRKIGKFVFKADEMNAMNLALEIHDAQLDASRVVDVERATDEVLRRLRNGVNTKKIMSASI